MAKHLWEIDHPYYCNHGNYYASQDPTTHYRSWAAFHDEWNDADKDYNLVFRWDWKEGEDHDLPKFNGDVNYRNGLLCVYFMGQRKGLYQWMTVDVCRADEPAIRKYLEPQWEYMRGLWEGISDAAPAEVA